MIQALRDLLDAQEQGPILIGQRTLQESMVDLIDRQWRRMDEIWIVVAVIPKFILKNFKGRKGPGACRFQISSEEMQRGFAPRVGQKSVLKVSNGRNGDGNMELWKLRRQIGNELLVPELQIFQLGIAI